MPARAAASFIDDATRAHEVTPARETVVVIGNFDGVHRGHQAVLAEAAALASSGGLLAAVLTFEPHPSTVVGPGAMAPLTSATRRFELLRSAGAGEVFVRRFDASFAAWSPERFAKELLSEFLRARVVIVGENFRFGAGREGDLARLVGLGQELGFTARAHALAKDESGPFSSTRVRAAVAAGDVEAARGVLGRPHAVSGVVARGDQRGRTLGFPTANLEGIVEMLPGDGVYAVLVDELEGEHASSLAKGVMNIGVRPTLSGERKRTVEAHLFDVDRDLYGKTLRAHFVARLRDEKRFSGLEELKAQIARDAADARARTTGYDVGESGAFG